MHAEAIVQTERAKQMLKTQTFCTKAILQIEIKQVQTQASNQRTVTAARIPQSVQTRRRTKLLSVWLTHMQNWK